MFGMLDYMAEGFHYVNFSMVPDGRGGSREAWTLGGPFTAVLSLSNSLEQETAQAQGVKGVYSVQCDRTTRLSYHQVFQRDKDGKIFRITSKDEDETPGFSPLNLRRARAEDYDLPGELEG